MIMNDNGNNDNDNGNSDMTNDFFFFTDEPAQSTITKWLAGGGETTAEGDDPNQSL